jgi:hypothetical protein
LDENLVREAGSTVVFAFYDVQGRQGESLGESPGHTEWGGDVESAAHEYRRNVGDATQPSADATGRQDPWCAKKCVTRRAKPRRNSASA